MSALIASVAQVAVPFALALALTIAVELPVAALMGLRDRRSLAAVALINVVTNPTLNFVLLALAVAVPAIEARPVAYWAAVAALELLVVLAEWRLLLWTLGGSSRHLLAVSVTMNAASFSAGLALMPLMSRVLG